MLRDRVFSEADYGSGFEQSKHVKGKWVTIKGNHVFIPDDAKEPVYYPWNKGKPWYKEQPKASASKPPEQSKLGQHDIFKPEPKTDSKFKSKWAPKPETPKDDADDSDAWIDAYLKGYAHPEASKSDKWGSWTKKERTPEEQKLHDLAKTLRDEPLKRTAAGGIVFKNFHAKRPGDLEILVAKTHPKWGSYWVIPKGGADPNEHIHDTASREVEEETGVKANVIGGHEPFVKTSTFGESGKYDPELVAQALKAAHPHEASFIDQHKDKLADEHFTYENASHYFLMQHVGGEPIQHAGQSHDQEMSEARFMPIREAMQLSSKIADVIDGLAPEIIKQWKAAKHPPGSPQPKNESLFDRIRTDWKLG